ncbi:hypothetical protein [Salinarchaeum laminariae]|uniref:hypothetical protein n=1 Tax=Salinarchaeum laminariae TaxID=869888 RepID=UPI0020C0E44D|nr:hypothetical protein [Salinarchaeum laminariae]
MTTVIDAKEAADGDGQAQTAAGDARDSADQAGGQNPFDGERIELPEREVTSVVRHEVAIGTLRAKLDSLASRIIYGA